MEEKDARFLLFWNKHKERPWRFRIMIGLMFGLFMLLVFGIKTYYFSEQHFDSLFDYLASMQFLLQFVLIVPIGGWLYGWIMYRYCVRAEKKIRDKYHES